MVLFLQYLVKEVGNLNRKKKPATFRFLRECVRCLYPKVTLSGKVPDFNSPLIFIGNHSQIHGPVMCELYLPKSAYTWCDGEVMDKKAVPAYAMRCFWPEKKDVVKPFYRVLSHVIAPLCELVFQSARTVPVYHDERIFTTFKESIDHLKKGHQLVIFPETERETDGILNELHTHFPDVARLYTKRTGEPISFVPMYICPELHEIHFGDQIPYCPENGADEERARLCREISEAIEKTAAALPLHTVVPFVNKPRALYRKNRECARDTEE